jgi:hypothetical protein
MTDPGAKPPSEPPPTRREGTSTPPAALAAPVVPAPPIAPAPPFAPTAPGIISSVLQALVVEQREMVRAAAAATPEPYGVDARTLLGGARNLTYGTAAPELGRALSAQEVVRIEDSIALLLLALASNRGAQAGHGHALRAP